MLCINRKQAEKVISQLHLYLTDQTLYVDKTGLVKKRKGKRAPKKSVFVCEYSKGMKEGDVWDILESMEKNNQLIIKE